MNLFKDCSLKKYNTFGIEARTRLLCEVFNIEELKQALEANRNERALILGGGSNILFTRDFDGLVMRPLLKGIEVVENTCTHAVVKALAGETWDDFVDYCVKANFGGVENLSGIPGNVGATPVQNVGAYGQEVCNVIDSVEALDMMSLDKRTFTRTECCFSLRNSIFKSNDMIRKRYVITSVRFRLEKNPEKFLTHYQGVSAKMSGIEPSLKNLREAILSIRNEKLPDPARLGNAGSFFLNNEYSVDDFDVLARKYAGLKNAPVIRMKDKIKVPSAWLIEQCGFKGKGKRENKSVGAHENHALVLVNYGGATGNDVVECMHEIQSAVKSRFGICLHPEVNVI